MKKLRFLYTIQIILFLSAIVAISGCSDFTSLVRKVTYPPDFKYVSGDELRSNMNQLAFQLQILDQALAESDTEQPTQQKHVMTALRNIQSISAGLQAGEAGSSHPFLQDFMRNFVIDVEQARNDANLNPPRYYFAGRLAGGCVNCHKVNR